MKTKYLIAALACSVCAAGFSPAGAGAAFAEETEQMTEASEGSSEAQSTEAGSGSNEETEIHLEEPEYKALDYVKLGEYKGLKITADPAQYQITDEMIETRIKSELKDADLLEEITEVRSGDIVNIDYEGKLDGEAFEGGTASGYELEIGSGTFIPGFEDGLIGVAVGETVDLPLTFPEQYTEDLAGKDVVFTVTVNSGKRMPELTDELAVQVSQGEFTDAASYRSHIEEELQATADSAQENQIYSELMTLIANTSEIESYPTGLIEYVSENVQSYYRKAAEAYGLEFQEFIENGLQTTVEYFNQTVDAMAEQNVRQMMLLKAIAEKENIEISDEEFEEECQTMAEQNGFASSEDMLDIYSEDEIRSSLLQDKVIKFVRDNAVIVEPSEEESEIETEAQ